MSREKWAIDADQLRLARKILDTVTGEYPLSPAEQTFLLQAVTLVALRDALDQGEVEWTGAHTPLQFTEARFEAVVVDDPSHPLALHPGVTPETSDAAYLLAEQLLDSHGVPELERAGLYSALPCLGLHALQGRFLDWKIPPPFSALAAAGPCPARAPAPPGTRGRRRTAKGKRERPSGKKT